MITFTLNSPALAINPGSIGIDITIVSDNEPVNFKDSFLLYVNNYLIEPGVTEGVGDYTVTATLTVSGGQGLLISMHATDADGAAADHWKVAVSNPVLKSDEQYFVSSMLDRLLAYYPDYTKARGDNYSITRQLLNPVALKFEENRERINAANRSLSVSQLDHNEPAWIYINELAQGEEFSSHISAKGDLVYSVPSVWGYKSWNRTPLTAVESFRELWEEALPSRYSIETQTGVIKPLTPSTPITAISEIQEFNVPVTNKLWVEVHSSSKLFDIDKKLGFTIIEVQGKGPTGRQQKEQVRLLRNEITPTRLEWSKITKLLLAVSPDDVDGELLLHNFPPRAHKQQDRLITKLDKDTTKNIWWHLDTDALGSFLYSKISGEGDLFDVVRNTDSTQVLEYYRLSDTAGSAISVDDFSLSATDTLLLGIDKDVLYIWDRRDEHHTNLSALSGQTLDPEVDVFISKFSAPEPSGGQLVTEITIEPDIPRGSKIARRWHWSIIKSDNSRLYLDQDGVQYTTKPIWINNTVPTEFFGLSQKVLTTNIIGTGDFIMELVVQYRDGTEEEVRKPFQIFNKTALAKFDLSYDITLANGVSSLHMDDHNELFIINNATAYKLIPVYDLFLPDYENDRILVRESYDNLEVVLNES